MSLQKKSSISVKKSLGSLGALVIYFIAGYAVYKDPSQVGNILWPLTVFVAALFGIKKFGYISKTNGVGDGGQ